MENNNYIQEPCMICSGERNIQVSEDDLVAVSIMMCKLKTCPYCEGNGFIKYYIKKDEIK